MLNSFITSKLLSVREKLLSDIIMVVDGLVVKSQVLSIKESYFSDNSSIPNKTNRLETT